MQQEQLKISYKNIAQSWRKVILNALLLKRIINDEMNSDIFALDPESKKLAKLAFEYAIVNLGAREALYFGVNTLKYDHFAEWMQS